MKKEQIGLFFERLSEVNPNPTTELNYTNSYTLLIAVVMSAQSTDVGVNKATDKLFPVADSPEAMVALGEDGLKEHIKTIGLYNSKAKNVIRLSQQLIEKHQGKVPRDRKDLEALPGVGRKTANVVLNTLYGEPVIAVDTHLFRLGNRTGLAKGKTPLEVEQKLMKRIPAKWLINAHHWLILHGRYVCKARTPLCGACVVRDVCDYKDKTEAIA